MHRAASIQDGKLVYDFDGLKTVHDLGVYVKFCLCQAPHAFFGAHLMLFGAYLSMESFFNLFQDVKVLFKATRGN